MAVKASTIRNLLLCGLALTVCTAAFAADAPVPDAREAKKVFGAIRTPLKQAPKAIGQYDRGCVAGAQNLPLKGPDWQVMRVSRNRFWGHPALTRYILKLAADMHQFESWSGILVGDMAQPIGGPLLGGHASHQIGLDADLWYTPMPSRTLTAAERESMAAQNMVDQPTLTVDPAAFTEAQIKLLQRAASYPEVARIFVHPAVKKALCNAAGANRDWLRKIRPWYKHDDHFHVRLSCPSDSADCVPQAPVAQDDGCGQELDDWFKKLRAVPKRSTKPPVPAKPMLVSDLPKECQTLLHATERAASGKAAAN